MIQKFTLHNFQSHKDTELEFDKGVNVIIGSSDSGKSAILRGLYWLIENRPLGTGYISTWADDGCTVGVQVEDNVIKHTRTKTVNGYEIINRHEEESNKKLDAIGTEVPQEVSDLLNITDLNIGKQMDTPFLLSQSSGEVARFLNKTIHLDNIDVMLARVESWKRSAKQNYLQAETQITDVSQEIEELDWLDALAPLIVEMESAEKEIISLLKEESELSEEIDDVIEIRKTLQKIDSVLPKLKIRVGKLDVLTQEVATEQEKIHDLEPTITQYIRYSEWLQSIPSIKDLRSRMEFIEQIRVQMKVVVIQVSDIEQNIDKYVKAQDSINTSEKELILLKKKVPKECPLCHSPIKEII